MDACRKIEIPPTPQAPTCKKINEPVLYNLGFIPADSTELRLAQGLESQKLANLCSGQNTYVCGVLRPDTLYPITLPSPEYGIENHIPDHCNCLQYVRSP